MTDDTKSLLKSAASNVVTILGYISTASTFLPVMAFLRPYLRPIGAVLIIVGIFRGAQSVLKSKHAQMEKLTAVKDAEIAALHAEKDREIAALSRRVEELSRNPYSENLVRTVRQVIYEQMTLQGRLLLRHLLMHDPIEVGRPFGQPSIETQNEQMAIAVRSGIVRLDEKRHGGMVWTYYIVNPEFRPILKKVLYEREDQARTGSQ